LLPRREYLILQRPTPLLYSPAQHEPLVFDHTLIQLSDIAGIAEVFRPFSVFTEDRPIDLIDFIEKLVDVRDRG
jgi:hypothetical protein